MPTLWSGFLFFVHAPAFTSFIHLVNTRFGCARVSGNFIHPPPLPGLNPTPQDSALRNRNCDCRPAERRVNDGTETDANVCGIFLTELRCLLQTRCELGWGDSHDWIRHTSDRKFAPP